MITENKTSRIEEKLDRITETLQVLLRANFRGWSYKFLTREGRSPIFLVYKTRNEEVHFHLDFDGIIRDAEQRQGWPSDKIRMTALEFALMIGRWCDLKAVQIEELARYVGKTVWLLAD